MGYKALLSQECTIHRKTKTKNAYGHVINTWVAQATHVKCRIQYMFVTSAFLSQTPVSQITGNDYVGFFEKTLDIKHGDRVTWEGLYLYVRPINPIFGNRSKHHLEVMMGLQET